jgi:predicted ATP-grasp superfamily ATP-dependent carboligase
MSSANLLIVGASTRAAAFSALRAGLQPWCVDLFADLDLRQRCSVTRLSGRYPHGFQSFINSDLPGPWIYTGGLENWPRLVQRMAERRLLWGNAAPVLRRARAPEYVTGVLQAAGLPVPTLGQREEKKSGPVRWLVKPRRGAGGSGIHFESDQAAEESGTYRQEYVEGMPCSLLYLGDGRRAVLLGMTEQLIGEPWLRAAPFRYCGSIGPIDPGMVRRPDLEHLGGVLAQSCGLRGLFGVDGVLRDGVFWPVEINPRYVASVEVIEYAGGWPILAWHAHVFQRGELPSIATAGRVERCIGKAILFARADPRFPSDGPWMAELDSPRPIQELPDYADVPAAGQVIEVGHPILTLFAQADSPAACKESLRQRVDRLSSKDVAPGGGMPLALIRQSGRS